MSSTLYIILPFFYSVHFARMILMVSHHSFTECPRCHFDIAYFKQTGDSIWAYYLDKGQLVKLLGLCSSLVLCNSSIVAELINKFNQVSAQKKL